MYHEVIEVVEHPIDKEGVVEEEDFRIEAYFLDHGVDTIGWRIQERDERKFDKAKLKANGLEGPIIKRLEVEGRVGNVSLDDVSRLRSGDIFTYIADTLSCEAAVRAARDATLLLCESTYLSSHEELAIKHHHLTAKQAAEIAKRARAKQLVLTHFSARYQDLTAFITEAAAIFPNTLIAEDLRVFPFPKSF
jgi:ribonuclease Z